jgi:hypothetical protein
MIPMMIVTSSRRSADMDLNTAKAMAAVMLVEQLVLVTLLGTPMGEPTLLIFCRYGVPARP